jgi:DNA-binding MarR family transcriptional regulator
VETLLVLSRTQFAALSRFRTALASFQRFSERAARAAGITPMQYLLLLHLRAAPEPLTVGALAKLLCASPHGTVALITRSAKARLVRRRRHPHDARCVDVHLTARGKRLVELVASRHRAELESLRAVFRVAGVS